MTSTTNTTTRVDVGALAASIKGDAYRRLAAAFTASLTTLDDNENPLNETQRAEMLSGLLDSFDRFERSVAADLVHDLAKSGVTMWGLGDDLEDLLERLGA
jgi:hypothetical protein